MIDEMVAHYRVWIDGRDHGHFVSLGDALREYREATRSSGCVPVRAAGAGVPATCIERSPRYSARYRSERAAR